MKSQTGVEVRSAPVVRLVKHLAALEAAGAVTATSLRLSDPELPFSTYEALGAYIGHLRDATAWWFGDWLLFGEGVYGERYAQAVESSGRAKSTLEDYARVALYIPPKRRKAKLTFHHHRLVAKRAITPEDADAWLARAIDHGWSVEEMAGAMQAITAGGTNGSDPPALGSADARRVVEIAGRIAREANPLGDGRYAVDGELIVQLRAAAGEER